MSRRPYDEKRLARRFWAKVDQTGECWIWTAYRNPQTRYGQFTLNESEREALVMLRVVTAPVLAATLTHGPAPDGTMVLHSCDDRACCRPDHLRWDTAAANNREAWDRGRQRSGEGHHQARLSDAQVAEVCRRARTGERVIDLAAEYGADWSQIYRWMSGEVRATAGSEVA